MSTQNTMVNAVDPEGKWLYRVSGISAIVFGVAYILTLTLSVGILLTGLVMLKGIFSKIAAYVGVLTGVLGIVSVTNSFFSSSLSGITIILASILTTMWYLVVGYRLYHLDQ